MLFIIWLIAGNLESYINIKVEEGHFSTFFLLFSFFFLVDYGLWHLRGLFQLVVSWKGQSLLEVSH